MKMTQKSKYVFAAFFSLVAAFPLAVSTPIGNAKGLVATVATTEQQHALDNRDEYRDNRKEYLKARDLCIQLRVKNASIECPDVNDAAGIANFLKNHGKTTGQVSSTSAASSTASVSSDTTVTKQAKLTVGQLSEGQKQTLRWYRKINFCPTTLKDSVPAFYELCQSFLNPHPTLLESHVKSVDLGPVPNATLKEIIEANKGVRRTQR